MSRSIQRGTAVALIAAPALVVVALVFAGDQVSGGVAPDVRASIMLGATLARGVAILLAVAWIAAVVTLLARAVRARRHGGSGRP